MSQYRHHLPQLGEAPLLTDGGLETTLVFHDGMQLPHFAAFDLLKNDAGTARLRQYFTLYADIAKSRGVGFVLEAPTWRASSDWGKKLGYDRAALADANRKAIELLLEVRTAYQTPDTPYVISGNLGPRGDGYRPDARMSVDEARAYHAAQIETFAATEADLVSAFTLNYAEEAIGVVRAARDAAMPVCISFTLETDGRLPSGESLAQALARTEEATEGYAAYYMLNCAHPSHFADVLAQGGAWRRRVRGVRANASVKSHAELDESTELDIGDPDELSLQYRALGELLPSLVVLGGCCGTDHRHVAHIARRCLAHEARSTSTPGAGIALSPSN